MRKGRTVRFTLVAIAVLGLALPAIAGQIQSSVRVLEETAFVDNGVVVDFSLTNTSPEAVYVLQYETPLNGFERDLFVVERNGEPIPYMGIVAMRLGPTAKDWMRIDPGQSVSRKVTLSAVYDMRRGGSYTIQYKATQHVMADTGELLPLADMDEAKAASFVAAREQVVSQVASVEVVDNGKPIGEWVYPDPSLLNEKNTYYSCQSTSTIVSAENTAKSRTATAYYACAYSNWTWYRTWFGSTDSYKSTVQSRFANSYWAIDASITYDCRGYSCQSNWVAYVYKNRPYEIWICPAFWYQSASFRAHAIAHETFHWYIVAGADDVGYGESFCRNLAQTSPYDALRNADSYAYAADYAYY